MEQRDQVVPNYTFKCNWCEVGYKIKDSNANDATHYCSRDCELKDENEK